MTVRLRPLEVPETTRLWAPLGVPGSFGMLVPPPHPAIAISDSTVFAGQAVGIKEVHDDIWLVSFMDYDLGYFDLETRMLEPLENPFGPKVLPRS